MPDSLPIPRRVAVITHPALTEVAADIDQIAAFLRARGLTVTTGLYNDPDLRRSVDDGQVDLLIALGGDGTMLRTGHLGAPAGVPVLGINHGRFGFLIEVRQAEWQPSLERLLAGQYRLEERMMLSAQHRRGDECLACADVINEVVVTRGRYVRPVRLEAFVDGYRLARYVADGLIAATPTGSSAYALAAAGPIMPPELRNILIVPVAPHLSVDRAVILSEGARVDITVYTDHEAVFSVDGQPAVPMQNGDTVHVEASPNVVRFVRFQDPGYFYRNLTNYMEQNPSAGDLK
jgi:NAD+ kinase